MTLPEGFRSLIDSYNSPIFDGLSEALASGEPSVAIRPNLIKGSALQPGLRCIPWCGHAAWLDNRQAFTFDPAFHQGLYYVQDPSSMFLAHVLRKLTGDSGSPLVYLDACAAPGGKTTVAIDILPRGSFIVANEYSPQRARTLVDNIVKWGSPCVAVTRGDAAAFRRLGPTFDIIAADVPCSGEGMMRKDPDAAAQWSESLIGRCAAAQRDIVGNLWQALRPGGYLIYSTCTFNRTENEDNVQWIIDETGAEPVTIGYPDEWNIAPSLDSGLPAMRFIPGRIEGEGLFMAVLRKPDGESSPKSPAKPAKNTTKPNPEVEKWIKNPADYRFVELNGEICAIPSQATALVGNLARQFDLLSAGTAVAAVKGRDLIPAHALAMSTGLMRDDAFAACDIDYPKAIAYLRGETISFPDGTPRGIVLVTYVGRPLGFAKNLGNRANNMYPKSLRILSTHSPDTPPSLIRQI